MSTTTADISHALTVDGWMSEVELQWLADQAQTHHVIVELGSYLGRSTSALAANCSGTVYALDDWNGLRDTMDQYGNPWHNPAPDALYKSFLRNTRAFTNIVPIKCSHESPTETPTPNMVFIDGSHEYEDVRRDILYWKSKVALGGMLCGHDYDPFAWPGVCRAVDEIFPQGVRVCGTIWYCIQKRMEILDLKEVSRRTGLRLPGEPKKTVQPATEIPPWQYLNRDRLPKNVGVALGIASSGRYVPFEMAYALSRLAFPPSTNRIHIAVKGVKRDLAREGIAEQAIELGARNLLFIDDDNPPPEDTVYKLLQTIDSADDDVAVVAGIYCTKENPPSPLVFQSEGGGPFWRWKKGDIFECESIATGCMMIRCSALAQIPKPWFRDVTTPEEAKELGLLNPDSSAIHFEMTESRDAPDRITPPHQPSRHRGRQ
jgi:hypothetical protein